ncbi:MAG: dTDP-4-dehydrorhamnose reductase [Gammaproteobacteria bacterium]|nr:dTDP-4-dehydrorhamnose reductase [Gammaproteobacteria bacterium]
MKVLVTGAAGQLGGELLRRAPDGAQVRAMTRAELDITDSTAVETCLASERPAVVLNAAAYTAVDQAEREPRQAYAVNAVAPGILARACDRWGIRLIHVSSDYVFDGRALAPYRPSDRPGPLSAYGGSKREGEEAVLGASSRAVIVRSAWLYSAWGEGFVQAILKKARAGQSLRVVGDQVGSPTWAASLAGVLWRLAERNDVAGMFHHADAGQASWFEFALAILEDATARGMLPEAPPIERVTTREYGAPAQRPAFSVLDSSETCALLGVESVHWRTNLRLMFDEMVAAHV